MCTALYLFCAYSSHILLAYIRFPSILFFCFCIHCCCAYNMLIGLFVSFAAAWLLLFIITALLLLVAASAFFTLPLHVVLHTTSLKHAFDQLARKVCFFVALLALDYLMWLSIASLVSPCCRSGHWLFVAFLLLPHIGMPRKSTFRCRAYNICILHISYFFMHFFSFVSYCSAAALVLVDIFAAAVVK